MSGKKIKIALCLSGEPRSSMFCFPYIYESFINLGPNYEVDVYIHSWKNFRALPLFNSTSTKIEPEKPKEILQELPFDYNTSHYYNHSLMYYSIRECFNLIKKPYDVYIRCRLDLMFESKLILNPIFNDIIFNEYDMFSLYNDYPTKTLGGVDDQVIICNFKGAKSLSQYYTQLSSNYQKNFDILTKQFNGFYAEGYLEHYLKEQNLKFFTSPLSGSRLVRYSQFEADTPLTFLDQ